MPNVPGLLVTTRRLCYQLNIAPPHRSGRFWPVAAVNHMVVFITLADGLSRRPWRGGFV